MAHVIFASKICLQSANWSALFILTFDLVVYIMSKRKPLVFFLIHHLHLQKMQKKKKTTYVQQYLVDSLFSGLLLLCCSEFALQPLQQFCTTSFCAQFTWSPAFVSLYSSLHPACVITRQIICICKLYVLKILEGCRFKASGRCPYPELFTTEQLQG